MKGFLAIAVLTVAVIALVGAVGPPASPPDLDPAPVVTGAPDFDLDIVLIDPAGSEVAAPDGAESLAGSACNSCAIMGIDSDGTRGDELYLVGGCGWDGDLARRPGVRGHAPIPGGWRPLTIFC